MGLTKKQRDKAIKMRLEGATAQSVADAIGCSLGTINNWMRDYRSAEKKQIEGENKMIFYKTKAETYEKAYKSLCRALGKNENVR